MSHIDLSQGRRTLESRIVAKGMNVGVSRSIAMSLLALSGLLANVGCNMLADTNNTQGSQLFQSGRYNEAIGAFQQALQRDPANADAYYNLASTYHHLGMATRDASMVTQAETLYNESLNRDPNHIDAHRGLAVLLVQDGRKDAAFTLLRRWAAAAPLSAEPKIELARLYREFGDTQTATELLAEALKQDPQNVRANRAVGSIREEQGQIAAALDSYNRAWLANSSQTDLATRMAQLQQQLWTSATTTPSQMAQAPASSTTTGASGTTVATGTTVNTQGRY